MAQFKRTDWLLLAIAVMILVLIAAKAHGQVDCQRADRTKVTCDARGQSIQVKWHVLPEYKPKIHFWNRHPQLTIWGIAAVMGGAGVAINRLTTHNCPSMYDGKPYSGTPPCPK